MGERPAAASSSDPSESTDVTDTRGVEAGGEARPRDPAGFDLDGVRNATMEFWVGERSLGIPFDILRGVGVFGVAPGPVFPVSGFPLSRRRWSFPAPADRSRLELPPAHEVRTRLANQRHAYAPRPRFTREEFQVADDLGPVVPGRGRRGGRRRGWRVRLGRDGFVLGDSASPGFPARLPRAAARASFARRLLISAASDSTGSAASTCRRNLHGVMFLFPAVLTTPTARNSTPSARSAPRRRARSRPASPASIAAVARKSHSRRSGKTFSRTRRGSNSHALRISASAATSGSSPPPEPATRVRARG